MENIRKPSKKKRKEKKIQNLSTATVFLISVKDIQIFPIHFRTFSRLKRGVRVSSIPAAALRPGLLALRLAS